MWTKSLTWPEWTAITLALLGAAGGALAAIVPVPALGLPAYLVALGGLVVLLAERDLRQRRMR